MRRAFPALLISFFLSCSGKNDVPAGILPREEMEKVVWDLVQADQYYREYVVRDSTKRNVKDERYNLYEQVFQMHKITRSTFDKSFAYYSQHPALMKDVFDSLSFKGARRMQDIYKPAIPTTNSSSIKGKAAKSSRDSALVK